MGVRVELIGGGIIAGEVHAQVAGIKHVEARVTVHAGVPFLTEKFAVGGDDFLVEGVCESFQVSFVEADTVFDPEIDVIANVLQGGVDLGIDIRVGVGSPEGFLVADGIGASVSINSLGTSGFPPRRDARSMGSLMGIVVWLSSARVWAAFSCSTASSDRVLGSTKGVGVASPKLNGVSIAGMAVERTFIERMVVPAIITRHKQTTHKIRIAVMISTIFTELFIFILTFPTAAITARQPAKHCTQSAGFGKQII